MFVILGLVLGVVQLCIERAPHIPSLRRTWAEEHAGAFRNLDVLGYPPNGMWRESQWAQELSSQRSTVLSAWTSVERELVAFAATERVLDETTLSSLVVHPSWRGRGLARTLLLAALWSARAAAQRALTLEVRASNVEAVGLYSCCGMREVGRRPRYYKLPLPAEDALLYTAHLDDHDVDNELAVLVDSQRADVRAAIHAAAQAEASSSLDAREQMCLAKLALP